MHTEIPKAEQLEGEVFSVNGTNDFEKVALAVFQYQYNNNQVYRSYADLLKKTPASVTTHTDVPFLPISFFKTHAVVAGSFAPQLVFESSGTSGSTTSRHLVKKAAVYQNSFKKGFERFYSSANQYCILGLLPSYLERSSSSLVYMVNNLIKESRHPQSGFYLYNLEQLAQTLLQLEAAGQKTILIGVTYALLDFAEKFPMPLQHTIVIETGGMKGRKKELVRSEVHAQLQQAFSLSSIHSEYGMTELLSQAYATAEGRFHTPPWMQVLIREEDDPLALATGTRSGGINIIDLANIYSCSFIATEDAGKRYSDGSFEVLGRLDNTDIRGCSLLTI